MSNETISELRSHLFAALKGLSDKTSPMEIDRARAICDVGQVIINSAKVEVEHMKVVGGEGSGFIGEAVPRLPNGIVHQEPGVTVRRHVLK